ncbi:MAG: hypothetical protein CM1200mP28_09320 [Deltaproteobacteria bacterium]|nr:MAG: hypothetical protein CM1200mP28_09320 [Deltaproteobacteria bacterium]
MEAFMYRHHPQWQLAIGLINEGRIGTVKTVHSFFSYYNDDPENIRNMANIWGWRSDGHRVLLHFSGKINL